MPGGPESYPLPHDPALAEVAEAVRDTGHWAWIVDDRWQLVYVTDELRESFGGGPLVDHAVGHHFFGQEQLDTTRTWRFGPNTEELQRVLFSKCGGLLLHDAGGDRDAVRRAAAPRFHDLIDGLQPDGGSGLGEVILATSIHESFNVHLLALRVRDADGRHAGTVLITKPRVGMATAANMLFELDTDHLAQMQRMAVPARRPAAILFADLEGSSPLARRLSTSSYFSLARRLVRTADRCIIDAGGLVGRHAGDGVMAFFLAESLGSESAAARACITAVRGLRDAVRDVAARSSLDADDVVVRFGLHWGSTLYVGSINTSGRSEVAALGDEVNQAARIEACATGGRTLASRDLVERLDPDDAAALGLDPDHLTYTALRDLATATEKARRDAPAIPVCDV